MKYEDKTRERFLDELMSLRQRIAGLETSEARHKKAEEALRQSEQKYRYLVDNSEEIILILSKKGKILFANRKTMDVSGYYEDQIVGQSIVKFLTKDSIPKALYALGKEFLGRPQPVMDVKMKTKSGEVRYLEIAQGSSFVYEIGKRIGIIVSGHDVTERRLAEEARRRAEKALWESEERFRKFFENEPDYCYMISPEGKILDVNGAALHVLGYKEEELIGKPLKTICAPESLPRMKRLFAKWRKTGALKDEEMVIVTKRGDRRTVLLSAGAVEDKDGEVLYSVSVQKDITERKLAEEASKRAEEQIQKELKEKEVLLKEIHHRVKNNLQVISSLLNLQGQYIKDKEALALFEESRNRIRTMALIHEKLYRSKDLARIDFAGYIKDLAMGLYRSYGADPRRVVLDVKVEDVSLGVDLAIPCGLVVNELVSNSLKYAFPPDWEGKGRIRVVLGKKGEGGIELIVSDNGVGLPEDLDIRKTESLGLHLVVILAEDQLGGKISLDRKKGTKLRISFRAT